jgi:hypothetical protein
VCLLLLVLLMLLLLLLTPAATRPAVAASPLRVQHCQRSVRGVQRRRLLQRWGCVSHELRRGHVFPRVVPAADGGAYLKV